jgi:hypothetical protein
MCSSAIYENNCYEPEMPSDYSTCPSSSYRVNKCNYLVGQTWVEVSAGDASPYGASCAAYAACTVQRGSYTGSTMPTDKYFVMCEACASGFRTLETNNSPTGTCGQSTKITSCTDQANPDTGPDEPPPAPPVPTPAPLVDKPDFLEENIE